MKSAANLAAVSKSACSFKPAWCLEMGGAAGEQEQQSLIGSDGKYPFGQTCCDW